MDRDFWNERYQSHDSLYGYEPNVFFAEQLRLLKPGNILLPAEGEGRNALFAASIGWTVDAFDFSEEARRKALSTVAAAKLTIDYTIRDMESVELPEHYYDAIALIYVHLGEPTRGNFFRKCVRALRPGGTLILEGFELAQLQNQSGGPKDKAMLYSLEVLRTHFYDLQFQRLTAEKITLNEGAFHAGPADIVRMVATKSSRPA